MNELILYINKLENDSFEGWTTEEKLAYLTACTSIKLKAKSIDKKAKK